MKKLLCVCVWQGMQFPTLDLGMEKAVLWWKQYNVEMYPIKCKNTIAIGMKLYLLEMLV